MVRPCARKVHQPGYARNSGSPYFTYGEIPGLRVGRKPHGRGVAGL